MIKKDLVEQYKRFNINTDFNNRWERGIPHHPKSMKLMNHIEMLDFNFASDYFDWNTGGDGDNGEVLLYELDCYFELQDAIAEERLA